MFAGFKYVAYLCNNKKGKYYKIRVEHTLLYKNKNHDNFNQHSN